MGHTRAQRCLTLVFRLTRHGQCTQNSNTHCIKPRRMLLHRRYFLLAVSGCLALPLIGLDIRSEVERTAEEVAARFAAEGMTGVDLTIATYGVGFVSSV